MLSVAAQSMRKSPECNGFSHHIWALCVCCCCVVVVNVVICVVVVFIVASAAATSLSLRFGAFDDDENVDCTANAIVSR